MTVTLRQPLTFEECQLVRHWRNDPIVTPMLRTGAKTYEEQAEFFKTVIDNPSNRDHRFYALEVGGVFVGMGGLTYLRRNPGDAEISLILHPSYRGLGIGPVAVDALLREAQRLGLKSVCGECYATGHVPFWTSQIRRHKAAFKWTWDLDSLSV